MNTTNKGLKVLRDELVNAPEGVKRNYNKIVSYLSGISNLRVMDLTQERLYQGVTDPGAIKILDNIANSIAELISYMRANQINFK